MRFARPRALAAALLGAGLALSVAAGGCHAGRETEELPSGALLSANRDALASVLGRLAAMKDTRLGRRAAAVARALPACEDLEARAESGSLGDLLDAIACASPPGPLAPLHAGRGERDVAFALPLGADGPRVRGALSVAGDGGVRASVDLPRSAFPDARALLVPGSRPPGPGVLSSEERLLQARVRPDGGLDVAALVPEGGQADRLFRLRSALFAGAVLDGTWELAVYLPTPGTAVPRAALALGFALRAPAVAALEEFIASLEATWPVHRSFFSVGEAEGACLLELKVLPELAPCYVATERALVVGWNPASVRRALDGESALDPEGGIVVNLERVAEADARLAGPAANAGTTRAAPWRHFSATGTRRGDRVRMRVELRSAEGA